MIEASINNNFGCDLPVVIIIETRDPNGVTTFLSYQSGFLNVNETQSMGVSWMPNSAGMYDLRTFALTSLTDPYILSKVDANEIIVKETTEPDG